MNSITIFGFSLTLLSNLKSSEKMDSREPGRIQVGRIYHHIQAMSDNSIDYGTLTLLFQDNVFAILPLALIISNAHEK